MTECPHPDCGKDFSRLGQHWNWYPDHRPELTDKQHQIVTGVLMSDGSINRNDKNPRLQIGSITRPYLEYLDNELGVLSAGISFDRTAEQCAEDMRNRNFRPDARVENYNDVYKWCSRNNPDLSKYSDWYDEGSKCWPEDLELTPITLKHFYCGDGSLTEERIRFAVWNERENRDKIRSYFERASLPTPTFVDGKRSCSACFTKDESKELFEYMGSPIKGFKYKWPEEQL